MSGGNGSVGRPGLGSRLAPSIGVGLTLIVLVVASSISGRLVSASATGADAWLPDDGHRIRFGQEMNTDIRFAEWTRTDILGLLQSDLTVFPAWSASADVELATTKFARLHTIQAGEDGAGSRLLDILWTLDSDGARLAIDSSFPSGNIRYFVPGRLDLPTGVSAGDEWVSTGTAHTWDSAAEGIVQQPYRASYTASAALGAPQGCLDVAMSMQVGTVASNERHTWCPGEGIVSYTDASGTWTPTSSSPAVTVDPDEPFEWAMADTLEFSARTVNSPSEPGNVSLESIWPPGLLNGGAVFAGQLVPVLLGVATTSPLELVWAARPGGTPTALTTLGGISLVATTNRQVVAYNNQGRWLWEAQLGDLAVVPPVRFGDRLAVVATLDGMVTALDLSSGAVMWRADVGAEIRSAPVAAGDKLLVANQAGALACINDQGDLVWVIDAGVPRSIAVTTGPEPVVVYGESGSLVVRGYSLTDGHQLWRNRVYADARDLIALDKVVVLRDDDTVLGLDWQTGAVVWRWSQEHTFAGVGGDRRVLVVSDTRLHLLSDDGREVRSWPHHLGTPSNSRPFLVVGGSAVIAYNGTGMDVGTRP